MQPFTEKYRPRSVQDIQGHAQAIERTLAYVRGYATEKKRGLLLYGAPGSGKTSLAHAIAAELHLELVEVNASDVRNSDAIQRHVGGALRQQSLFSQGKIILFDEMDGLSGTKDRGGIQTLVDLLKTSTYPVLLTANDPWDSKFSTLRKYVELVELKTLPYTSVLTVLRRVCDQEHILFEEEALKALARRSGGDLRGALTDLQTLGQDKLVDAADLEDLGDRRKAESMFNALTRVLKGRNAALAREAIDAVDQDIDEVFLWIDENVPREYTKAADVAAAMDALSRADVFRGRIRRWQHWRFLVYVIDLMTAGVSLAKHEKYAGFTKYQRSVRPLTYWRANQAVKKRNAIAQKVAERTHTSIREARSTLPYLAIMLRADARFGEQFLLAQDEIAWIVERT